MDLPKTSHLPLNVREALAQIATDAVALPPSDREMWYVLNRIAVLSTEICSEYEIPYQVYDDEKGEVIETTQPVRYPKT